MTQMDSATADDVLAAVARTAPPDIAILLQTARDQIDNLRAQIAEHERDNDKLAGLIHDECAERGWCAEYDEWRERVHEACIHFRLPERMVTHQAAFNVTAVFRTMPSQVAQATEIIRKVLVEQSDHSELEWLEEIDFAVTLRGEVTE